MQIIKKIWMNEGKKVETLMVIYKEIDLKKKDFNFCLLLNN